MIRSESEFVVGTVEFFGDLKKLSDFLAFHEASRLLLNFSFLTHSQLHVCHLARTNNITLCVYQLQPFYSQVMIYNNALLAGSGLFLLALFFFRVSPPKMVDGKTREGKNYNFNKRNEVFVVLIMTVILTVVSLQPAT